MATPIKFDTKELMDAISDIEEKLTDIPGQHPEVTYKIMSELERGIREDEYIPYREPHVKSKGNPKHLQDNVKVDPEYIWWRNTYANDKYYDSSVSRQFHINASPEWDKAYLQDHGEDFYEFVADTIMKEIFDE